jgi:transcriptional regulator with XRE-family HTH domain
MPISSQLREAVKQSGLSLNQIAKATGVSHSILSTFLSGGPGRDRDVRLERTADKLAEFFGLALAKQKGEAKAASLARKPKPKSGRPRKRDVAAKRTLQDG